MFSHRSSEIIAGVAAHCACRVLKRFCAALASASAVPMMASQAAPPTAPATAAQPPCDWFCAACALHWSYW